VRADRNRGSGVGRGRRTLLLHTSQYTQPRSFSWPMSGVRIEKGGSNCDTPHIAAYQRTTEAPITTA